MNSNDVRLEAARRQQETNLKINNDREEDATNTEKTGEMIGNVADWASIGLDVALSLVPGGKLAKAATDIAKTVGKIAKTGKAVKDTVQTTEKIAQAAKIAVKIAKTAKTVKKVKDVANLVKGVGVMTARGFQIAGAKKKEDAVAMANAGAQGLSAGKSTLEAASIVHHDFKKPSSPTASQPK